MRDMIYVERTILNDHGRSCVWEKKIHTRVDEHGNVRPVRICGKYFTTHTMGYLPSTDHNGQNHNKAA